MKCDEIAKVCHEVNRALCEATGDYSQVPWDEAPDWQRDSAISGVLAIIRGDVMGPSESHENWLKQKIAEGWKYGPIKHVESKHHPCLLPFDELPRSQQLKGSLFFEIVTHLYEGAR